MGQSHALLKAVRSLAWTSRLVHHEIVNDVSIQALTTRNYAWFEKKEKKKLNATREVIKALQYILK